MQLTLPTIYIVATDFPRLGLGSAGDVTDDPIAAYDQYADCRTDKQPVRAFMVQFCAETNAPETITEITADLEADYQAICEARGYDMAAE